MSYKTYSAETIAEFFLSITDPDSNDVSNLKLQKLCYYAQGLLTAMRGKPLFSETVEAWDHGPVVPDLYHQYKKHRKSPIPVVAGFDENQIASKDRQVLKDVYAFYGQFSPWRLREMSHKDKPWIDAYNDQDDKEITTEALADYFRPQVNVDYVKKVFGKAPPS